MPYNLAIGFVYLYGFHLINNNNNISRDNFGIIKRINKIQYE